MNQVANLKLTSLVDDSSFGKDFLGEHGSAFFVEADGKSFLFDTGATGKPLTSNLETLKIDLEEIEAFILSHPHYDHSGGIDQIVEKVSRKPIYCPTNSFIEQMPNRERLNKLFSNKIFMTENREIAPGLVVIKEQKSLYSRYPTKETNLVINVKDKGLVILVGCAHHGLEIIFSEARKAFENKFPIYALVGGLHLKDSSEQEIEKVIEMLKKENIQVILTNHCTGYKAIFQMIKELPKECEFISQTDSGTFHTGLSYQS